ncbi:MAG: asparagine synthase (glutamine-hydrolyzing) [candidate division KSB1 bacterium]|nr:asparagine synthase (glutamine-hydrolyzing) [candidate division KSB1 bacterium]
MCGFVGVLKCEERAAPLGEEVLGPMASLVRHRGPDDHGSYWDGTCGLAHQRLSIIDLSVAGRQPMGSEDGSVWVAYNGEVYNFRELRREFNLDQRHRFVSRTDTEVVIHLYEELGPACFKELNGMFAMALWDRRERTLYLARDPYGIKPLFYMQWQGAFWFASEIKALLMAPGFEARPSLEALFHYLSFDFVPDELTAFEGIRELRPGHVLSLRPGGQIHIERFFDIDYAVQQSMTEQEAIEQSLRLLTASVERQLIADVPVGVMLSGGMDSSALTALMARVRGDSDFHTFSLAFEDDSFDESWYARVVAETLHTHHHEILVTPQRVRELLPRYLCYIDEPYADGSAIPTYLLAECAKDYVTVLLSGEGGDEFFSGYDTHLAYKMRRLYRKVPALLRRGVIAPLVNRLPVSDKKLSFEFKAKRFVRGAEMDTATSHFAWRVVLAEEAKRQVLREPERFGFAPSVSYFQHAFAHCQAADELNRLLYVDYSFHLPDDLMIKNDRMTMAHSLEARVPYTDNELVSFLATVPVGLKLKGTRKKHLLRSALRGILPPVILNKKKVGLEMPYSRWLREELRDLSERYFAAGRLADTGLFNPDGVRLLWEEHLAKRVDHGRFLWGLLNYMLWHEAYVERGDFRSYLVEPRAPRPPT